MSHKDLKEFKVAIGCFDKAISLDPKSVDAHLNKGITFKSLEDNKSAIKCFDQVIVIDS